VESDPIGLSGGAASTFVYAYDNPLKYIDPRGLRPPGGAIDFRNFIRDSFFGGRFPDKDFRSDGMPWGYGCGDAGTDKFVPDAFFVASFFPGCRRHEDCYGSCGSSKAQCDRRLLQDLKEACEKEGYGAGCGAAARTYYAAMKTKWSQEAFDRAQREACKDCNK